MDNDCYLTDERRKQHMTDQNARKIEKIEKETGHAWVYLLECADNSLYCGWTDRIEHRLSAHRNGTASKYTRSRRPVTLVYLEECGTKSLALKRELQIKKLSRKEKLKLLTDPQNRLEAYRAHHPDI